MTAEPELAELNAVVAEFPPEMVRKVTEYARALKLPVDVPYWEQPGYSGEWTEEDMRDFTAASMKYYDQQYPEDEGYGDSTPPR